MTASHTLIAERYLLLESLGRGGMGHVWRGVDTKLNRPVAVKEIVPAEGLTPAEMAELRPRALREARAAARLNHPNVVRVYDIVIDDSVPWIVMEHVPSRSLLQIVAEDGPIPPSLAARYGLDVLAALTAAHHVGVLHRDVKPSNVLITETGRTVLTDFGLATIAGDPAVTRTGVVIGTPSFMAPERAADTVVGPAADLWSLGATLYFAVQGRSPYERASTLATLSALASEEPPFAPASGPLWPVLAGLLRREPGARLPAPTVRAMLRQVAGPLPSAPVVRPQLSPPALPSPPTGGPAIAPARVPRPLRRATVLVAAALAVVVGLLIWLVPRTVRAWEGMGSAPSAEPTPVSSAPPTTTPATSSPPGEAALVLPDGWHMYVDRTGFSVAVPKSWTVSRRGSIVYFDEPGPGRLLGIDQTDEPEPDPVADWRAKEAYRVARGDFPDYHRIRLVAVDYFIKAADWEFTYVRDGVRLHVNNRGFITSPHQAYGMWWSTPDSDWNRFLPDLRLIQRSFRPADG
jgi:serine/threonine protein kinase